MKKWLAPTGIVLLVTAFWSEPLFFGSVYCSHELQCYAHPWRTYSARLLARGELPLWNPYASCGFPHQSTPETAVFYPGSFLFYTLPFCKALNVAVVAHLALASLGAYWLASLIGLGGWARCLAAMAFGFNTWLVASIGFLPHFQTMAWLPVVVACFHSLVLRSTARNAVRTAAVGTMAFLAGYPEYCAQAWGIGLAYAATAAIFDKRGRGAISKRMLCVGLALGLGLLLTGIQSLPTAELGMHSARYGELSLCRASEICLPLRGQAIGLVFPYLFGGPGEGKLSGVFELWLRCSYVGIVTLFLAAVGTVRSMHKERQRWSAVFFVVVTVVCFLLAAGRLTPGYGLLFDHVRLVRWFRWPAKFVFPGLLGLSMLAGFGFQSLVAGRTNGPTQTALRVLWIAFNAFALIGAAVFLRRVDIRTVHHFRLLTFEWCKLLALINVSAWSLIRLEKRNKPRRFWVGLLFLALVADLFWAGRRTCVFLQDDVYALRPPAASRLALEPGAGRIVTPPQWPPAPYGARTKESFDAVRESLRENVNTLFDVPSAYGDYSLAVGTVTQYFEFAWSARANVRRELLARAGAGIVAGPEGIEAIRHADRAAWPRRVVVERDDRSCLARLVGGELAIGDCVVLGEARNDRMQPPRRAVIDADRPHDVVVRLEPGPDGWMLLRDTAFPGWRAVVDGRWRKIRTADLFQRAVRVRGDERRVRFAYEPQAFRFGLAATLLAVGMGVATAFAAPWHTLSTTTNAPNHRHGF